MKRRRIDYKSLGFLVLGIFSVVLPPNVTLLYGSFDSEARELRKQESELRKEADSENRRLGENKRRIEKLRSVTTSSDAEFSGDCYTCSELTGNACDEKVFRSLGFTN